MAPVSIWVLDLQSSEGYGARLHEIRYRRIETGLGISGALVSVVEGLVKQGHFQVMVGLLRHNSGFGQNGRKDSLHPHLPAPA
jgi:hypothetical protein